MVENQAEPDALERARAALEAPERSDAKAARLRREEDEALRARIVGWAARGGSLADLRAILAPAMLFLVLSLLGGVAVACAVPERPLVRAARIYLDLAAPVSTLSTAQADRWRAGVREWQTEAERVGEDR